MRQLITTPAQIGEILRGRRKSHGIPQQELAERLQISQSRLSTLEARPQDITLDRLLTLANLLGLEVVIRDKATTDASKAEW
jgi:HTH-type transcriptional regulator/antitoxin HipB